MGLPGLHKSDAIITLPRVSIIIRVFVDQLNTERCQFSLTAAAAAAAAAAVHIIVERDWRVTLKGEWRRVSGLNIGSVSPATGRRRHHPAVIQLRRTTTAAAGYDHGGYISPFVKAFLEYLLFSAGDTFAIVVAFFRAAARLSTFVGRPWSPRCCDNLRTCEVRGINHISPFFDWGLGFSHVRLANATYYYLVDPSVVDCCQRTTELIQARREQTTQTIICTCYIGSAHIALALLLVLSAEPLAATLCIPETGR